MWFGLHFGFLVLSSGFGFGFGLWFGYGIGLRKGLV